VVGQKRPAARSQVNVSVDRRTLLTLRLLAAREDVSVSDVLRPVIEAFVATELQSEDLTTAVNALEKSRTPSARWHRRTGGAG
jgi:hypothetical protein